MDISVVLITLNEEKNLRGCLDSVKWADEIVVVDSGSKDETIAIAEKHGARVFERKFDDFSSQKNFALGKAKQDWILFLDADERVDEVLAEEIKDAVKSGDAEGYYVPRKNIIFGKEFKYGGHQGDKHLRLFKKDRSRFINLIHEKVEVDGKVKDLENAIIHYSTQTIKDYWEKLDLYSDLKAKYLVKNGAKVPKHYILTKPLARFFKQYFLQKGYMDGTAGLVFYALSAYNEFVDYSKYWGQIKTR